MITLTRNDTDASLILPNGLRFTDEHAWRAIAQTDGEYTLSGAFVLQQGRKLAGRPVTLGGDDKHNWLDYHTAQTLLDWADVPELTMTLDYHGRQLTVCFAKSALSLAPVLWYHDQINVPYHATLYFLTV
ncbi:MAG: hypothetical protein Q4B71_00310 [Cardiobacteriaceae bacterium]|nr:hypothetical protein [Cardiobacteriaceae bacterium]